MTSESKRLLVRVGVPAGLVLAYFVGYPQDLAAVLQVAGQFLGLSSAISPWLYVLVAVTIICWTALRIAGEKPRNREVPPVP